MKARYYKTLHVYSTQKRRGNLRFQSFLRGIHVECLQGGSIIWNRYAIKPQKVLKLCTIQKHCQKKTYETTIFFVHSQILELRKCWLGQRHQIKFTFSLSRSSRLELFLKVLENSQYNTINKETLAQVFSCEFCDIFKNTFLYRKPPVASSMYRLLKHETRSIYNKDRVNIQNLSLNMQKHQQYMKSIYFRFHL